ncbi:Coa4p CYBJADRAFT_171698 [Cyberlindnera jadinii NRRL Y-1542]|uniref:CHCH domain-containing protein n=1 Tax=Cyberlindnera jadinii (strain ATCC 18201 / CBS 1600 / BCRC 20928 / JCM 3617 / NBRC 0987 / NRRL Y-1542) TaxID=983966 RepID=A0A1E4S5B9_CYBJN|nr:hypothetical protein CYBJADRAFT_171698 [Cyberlindnera jadinii NRRL Y-1542]ODV74685.1 hypothetical protein CYBJADRAFT_171698 [Cyberlindnera jadinii NRRL Y-1542]
MVNESTREQTPDTVEEEEVDDDEPDEWDKRINNTGCAAENLKLTLCHADTGDWRKCTKEMEEFKKCWELNKNNVRTSTVDSDEKF